MKRGEAELFMKECFLYFDKFGYNEKFVGDPVVKRIGIGKKDDELGDNRKEMKFRVKNKRVEAPTMVVNGAE